MKTKRLLFAIVLAAAVIPTARASTPMVAADYTASTAIAHSRIVGRVAATTTVSLAITLPISDPTGLDALLRRLYDPADPLYHHFLEPGEFAERFAPGVSDYQRVIAALSARGFSVTQTHPNRLVVDVAADAATVESTFQVHLVQFQHETGRTFFAADAAPTLPADLAGSIGAVVGLHNANVRHSHAHRADPAVSLAPRGTGPSGGLSPTDIKRAYNLTGTTATGSGQTIGLFELDGYTTADITAYAANFALTVPPLEPVLVDGATGTPGSGAAEVTLDIELSIGMASRLSKVLIYECPNSNTGVIDGYSRIANDNTAKAICTTWGDFESDIPVSVRQSENTIFQQMAAQGQSIYAAAGDNGAYDNGTTLSVDDPAAQPYVTGVGGTKLTLATDGSYVSETTWNGGSVALGAGGGGISQTWPIPSYQTGHVSTASKGSTTMRNVPDVALNADPNTGYSIYFNGSWEVYGGTSTATPLWTAYTALANELLHGNGQSSLGFANPTLYALGSNAGAYHDIADSSTNLFYPAVTGYDNATGWGSFTGTDMLRALIQEVSTGGSTGGSSGGTGKGCQMITGPAPTEGEVLAGVLLPGVGLLLLVWRERRRRIRGTFN